MRRLAPEDMDRDTGTERLGSGEWDRETGTGRLGVIIRIITWIHLSHQGPEPGSEFNYQ